MEDHFDHGLNGGGMVLVHSNGPEDTIISTIEGDTINPKRTDTIVDRSRLNPQVCFAPSNCFAYDGPNLMSG